MSRRDNAVTVGAGGEIDSEDSIRQQKDIHYWAMAN
jgi:hypothetical protein